MIQDDDLATESVRPAALALARLHLRTGALALARTELETMAGRDLLDDAGILDLAEVRWRTGDVDGAGAAVAALLEADPEAAAPGGVLDAPVAWVIAAEAAAARGRPTEARGHADRLRSRTADVDEVFAGQPRSSAWPPDPLTPVPTSGTLFPGGPGDEPADMRRPGSWPGDGPAVADAGDPAPATTGAPALAAAGMPGLWDAEPAEVDPELAAVAEAIAATEADLEVIDETDDGFVDDDALDDGPALPPADAVLDAGLADLRAGRIPEAAFQLALALRLAPALAPAVLDAIGDDDDAGLALVRGDAYRLVGHEREARRAYARAWPPTSLGGPPSDPDVPDAVTIEPDPEPGDDPEGDSSRT